MEGERKAAEGGIEGTGSDAEFHGPLLGRDHLPEPLLVAIRDQVRRAGGDPSMVQR
jgi:hypothetical protein